MECIRKIGVGAGIRPAPVVSEKAADAVWLRERADGEEMCDCVTEAGPYRDTPVAGIRSRLVGSRGDPPVDHA